MEIHAALERGRRAKQSPKAPEWGAGLLIRLLFRRGESLGLVEDVIHLHVKAVSLLCLAQHRHQFEVGQALEFIIGHFDAHTVEGVLDFS